MTKPEKCLLAWYGVNAVGNVVFVCITSSTLAAAVMGALFVWHVHAVTDLLGYSRRARAEKLIEDWRRVSDQWQASAEQWRTNYFDLTGAVFGQRRKDVASVVVDVTDPLNPKPLKVRPN